MDWNSIISVSLGGLIAIIGGFLGTIYSSKKEREHILFEQKLSAYSEFVLIASDLLFVLSNNSLPTEQYLFRIDAARAKLFVLSGRETRKLIGEFYTLLASLKLVFSSRDEIDANNDLTQEQKDELHGAAIQKLSGIKDAIILKEKIIESIREELKIKL